MKVEVTPEQYQAIRKLSDECANSMPDLCIDPYTPNPEYEKFISAGFGNYFDEAKFEKGMRELLGDETVEASKIEGVELVVVRNKNRPEMK